MRRLLKTLALALSVYTGGAFAQPQSPAEPIQPNPAQKVEPQYSDEAQIAGLEGTVLVDGVIAGDGSMKDLRISRPLGLGLDERAIEAVSQWRFAGATATTETATYPVDFTLPSKQSRWHLVGAEFKPPEGVSRPTFARADYPVGPGIGLAAYDEGRLLGAIGRAAFVTVSFDIDESGFPGNFQVLNASADVWGPQAAMLVSTWRFHPGTRGGIPVSVPCIVRLLWGPEDFTASAIARQLDLLYPQSAAPWAQRGLAPQLVSKADPVYTEAARQAGLEGTVVISLTIDQQGMPKDVQTHGGLGMGLDESAQEAVSHWRFAQPMLLNGQPAAIPMLVEIKFRLDGIESSFSPLSK
jgi:TonB family protein